MSFLATFKDIYFSIDNYKSKDYFTSNNSSYISFLATFKDIYFSIDNYKSKNCFTRNNS